MHIRLQYCRPDSKGLRNIMKLSCCEPKRSRHVVSVQIKFLLLPTGEKIRLIRNSWGTSWRWRGETFPFCNSRSGNRFSLFVLLRSSMSCRVFVYKMSKWKCGIFVHGDGNNTRGPQASHSEMIVPSFLCFPAPLQEETRSQKIHFCLLIKQELSVETNKIRIKQTCDSLRHEKRLCFVSPLRAHLVSSAHFLNFENAIKSELKSGSFRMRRRRLRRTEEKSSIFGIRQRFLFVVEGIRCGACHWHVRKSSRL